MTELADLRLADFVATLDEPYVLDLDGQGTLDLTLADARSAVDGPVGDGVVRAPFAVEFLGPVEPPLPQRVYRLTNVTLGELLLFIVPIGRDEHGMRYEAVFS